MTQSVRFVLDGKVTTAEGLPATMTVLDYLRERLHRTGTKEGCAEGDCGACMVAIGELAPDARSIRYRAVNSCIRFLPTIDGKELVTVESLQAPDGALHPVQQAMVDQHASQCGFCTPGFVMSLFALYLQGGQPNREQVLETLSGNLCRCTGYRPIIDAGLTMRDYTPPAHFGPDAPASPARCTLLAAIRRPDALRLPGFVAPRTIDELAISLERDPGAVVLAGGTDVGLWVTKQLRELPSIIYLGEVEALRRVQSDASGIVIGAAVPLAEAWDAMCAAYPALIEVAQRFGSPPVRNSGTLVGNLANGSPIGDALPVLIALGAELELRRGAMSRRLPLERFYLGYQRKDLSPGEFIVNVTVPAPRAGERIANYKLSKRFDQDISAVCGAFVVRIEDGRVAAARLAFGGMAATAARAHATEAALVGSAWSAERVGLAAARLAQDFEPLSDLRASAAFRLEVAGNMLRRFFLEHSTAGAALRTAAALPASA